ncbi:MAG: hypothetical protein SAK29_08910 [Scytonema sp. PMC 1069.18]|nr:hypothetical protein [Scytonema sp. PMC 1069.18]MEC4880027.1 hypothetical protein [Scytonema sp. PMC 1070.18]
MQIRKKVKSSASQSQLEQSQFKSHSSSDKAQRHAQKPLMQTETENQEFQQHQMEATKLKIQAKYGTITPQGQERLTVLQAKMNDVLHNKVEQESSFEKNTFSIKPPQSNGDIIQRVKSKDKTALASNDEALTASTDKDKALSASAATKEQFLKNYPLANQLIAGIDEKAPAQKILENLFNNFKNIDFHYTMVSKSHTTLLEGTREGDCQTLARAFKAIAEEYFGIQDIKIDSIRKPFLSEAGKTPYRGREPNCDNGKRWFFQNHYWAVWNGQVFDVLFLTHNKPTVDMARQDKPLQSLLMPEQEYYETEKGRVVYPYDKKYSTAELGMFEKLKNLVNNLGKWLYKDVNTIINRIQAIFIRGGNSNSDFEALIREVQQQQQANEAE